MKLDHASVLRAALRMSAGCLAAALFVCPVQGDEAVSPAVIGNYSVELTDDGAPPAPEINLPDISGYTKQSLRSKLPKQFKGTAAITSTKGVACLNECFEGKRSTLYQEMQGTRDTKVIKLSGAMTLAQVVTQINEPQVIHTKGQETIVRLPILVDQGAVLVIDGTTTPLVRLLTETGTILANAGTLFVIDASVTSWDEQRRAPTPFAAAADFRPFIASYATSMTYATDSIFQHLGYAAPSAYGFSVTSHPLRHQAESDGNWPSAILIDNIFEGLYYGFYSFEARDVVIVNNHYLKNIRYGIDPHDRSTRLIVANNLAEETVERHGIIGSREVNDSWFFHNISRRNGKSGMMLDRSCYGNTVAGNKVYDNGNGIALYESSKNQLVDNIVAFNNGTGVRVRNSADILIQNNTIVGNHGFAITCEGRRLEDHDKRLSRGDTYETVAGLSAFENTIAGNGDGIFKGASLAYLRVAGLGTTFDLAKLSAELGAAQRQLPIIDSDPLGGDLEGFETQFQAVLRSTQKTMLITGISSSGN